MPKTRFGITFIITCLIIGLIPMTVYSMPSGTNSKIITENDNGKIISIKNGDTFYLRLNASPSAGYLWKPILSNGLSLLETNYYPSEHINTFLFNFSYKKYIYNSIHLDLSRFVRTSRTIFFFPDISLTFWLYDSISQFNFHPSLRNKIQKNFFYKFYRT